MIEIKRKGFRFDIDPDQIVTFKKAQNLNGVQASYSYSNTIPLQPTANNKKLLDLFDLPTNKVASLMNGYEVDVVLNGSIQLRNQTLKIQKEGKDKIETYLLYSDNALVVKLKEQFLNSIASGFKYRKNVVDFNIFQFGTTSRTAYVETQEKSGFYVLEEMPLLIKIQELIRLVFTSNNYTVYGDFFVANNEVSKYYVAPNQGVYQIYDGISEGFSPTFDPAEDLFTFLTKALKFFNSYAEVDDTNRTVIVNRWTNLGNYKTSFADYSRFFVESKDFTFESKLAKRNELTYSDSGTTFNSFFTNTLSSQDKATYLASEFGAGTLNIFDDAELDPDTGLLSVRPNGAVGEISAMRIMKVPDTLISATLYNAGVGTVYTGPKAVAVSMRDVYAEFHKDYTDFILTPLIQNLVFRYDDILAASFSMTKVFFVEQQSSYWIPLEINFTTKKDLITIKALLIKKRKVPSPILENFNSILLDFKEKGIFPISYLLDMYPMPPNQYPIEEVIFKSYDETKNRLYVNDVFIPASSLPQVFSESSLASIKIEANAPGDSTPDKNSSSIYLQVVDSNGGVSNEAYINVVHTGKASLESNFAQSAPWSYSRDNFDDGFLDVNVLSYVDLGLKPNLNGVVTSVTPSQGDTATDAFNLVIAAEQYTSVKIDISGLLVRLRTDNNGLGHAKAVCRLLTTGDGNPARLMKEVSVSNNADTTFDMSGTYTIPTLNIGNKIRVFFDLTFDNTRSGNAGDMDVKVDITGMKVKISTIKTV